jgi:hypothetical protein
VTWESIEIDCVSGLATQDKHLWQMALITQGLRDSVYVVA